jgi:hypothetical protein
VAKLVPGVNDLQTLFPEVAREADGWDPRLVSSGSDKPRSWKCKEGHCWKASPNSRTSKRTTFCPVCAGKQTLPGTNDLKTLFPDLATEADGWDPSKVAPGSSKKRRWLCSKGHTWESPPFRRTGPQKGGCPYCAGKAAWKGFNDLATLFPELAKEADGWDPSEVVAGSGKNLPWRCGKGHTWTTSVNKRTPPNPTGCPVCAGNAVQKGYNDLATRFPELAKEALGWDPTTVSAGSERRVEWRCDLGHTWKAKVGNRTPPRKGGCPVCSGKRVLAGFNDLSSKFPEVAAEAYNWDPTTVTTKSNKKLGWRCQLGHTWEAAVTTRTPPVSAGCPVCAGKVVLKGFNDLQTLFPELAKEADGWDPTTVTLGSGLTRRWKCSEGHSWEAVVKSRTPPQLSGCPTCAEFGFKPELAAWFYLLERPGEQQLGVTNEPEVRLKTHARKGWNEVELVGPFPGRRVLETEKRLKQWLKTEVGLVPGTYENWFTAKLEVRSLAELKTKSGVETDLF